MWKKVITPTVWVTLAWIVGSAVTTYNIHRLSDTYTRALTEDVTTIRAAWAMQETLWRLQAVVMETEDKDRQETRIEASELEAAFEQHLVEAEETSFTPPEQAASKVVRARFGLYRNQIEAHFQSLGPNSTHAERAAERQKTIRLARALAEPCRQLVEINERQLTENTTRTAHISTVINLVRLAFLILGPILGLVFGLWIAQRLRHSISQISVTLSDATGDLNREVGPVEIQRLDDLPGLHQQIQTVTGRIRQVMNELQQTRYQALLAERLAAVGELAAGVAHELRNPLTSIKLLIQIAAQRRPDAPLGGKQFQVVQQEIAHMEGTIQGLLDFARPPQLHRVVHDLRDTVRRALNLVEGRLRQQHIVVDEQVPNAPVVVDGDPEQLHQIFVNLLLNGIEAMPAGGSLTIAIRADGAACHTCRASVTDSGAGIPPAILERMFEPFTSNKQSGTGLGLAISHRIAREHGGVLSAANRAEGGAAFTLELPLSPDHPHDKAAGH